MLHKSMGDFILERRLRIETALQSPEYKMWVQQCDEFRRTCPFYHPNTSYLSVNRCESCSNYDDVCSHIEMEHGLIPSIPLIV